MELSEQNISIFNIKQPSQQSSRESSPAQSDLHVLKEQVAVMASRLTKRGYQSHLRPSGVLVDHGKPQLIDPIDTWENVYERLAPIYGKLFRRGNIKFVAAETQEAQDKVDASYALCRDRLAGWLSCSLFNPLLETQFIIANADRQQSCT